MGLWVTFENLEVFEDIKNAAYFRAQEASTCYGIVTRNSVKLLDRAIDNVLGAENSYT